MERASGIDVPKLARGLDADVAEARAAAARGVKSPRVPIGVAPMVRVPEADMRGPSGCRHMAIHIAD